MIQNVSYNEGDLIRKWGDGVKTYQAPEIVLHQEVVFENSFGSGFNGGGKGSGSGGKGKGKGWPW